MELFYLVFVFAFSHLIHPKIRYAVFDAVDTNGDS